MNSGALMLLTSAIIWGMAFVAQSIGMGYVETFTFNGIRMILGALTLLPLILIRRKNHADQTISGKGSKKDLILGSLISGTFLGIATNLQQIGLMYTSVGKAGFITAMYIIFVPVLHIFMGKKEGRNTWIAVALSCVGLYLLCNLSSLSFNVGDRFELLCAVFFACQILTVDHYAPLVDGVQLSAGQFLVCGLSSLVLMFAVEHPQLNQIWAARMSILYTGIFSSGVAYTLQILGQRRLEPAKASLIMCLESPISAIGGWLILRQVLSVKELLGCVFMFAAIIISQRKEAA